MGSSRGKDNALKALEMLSSDFSNVPPSPTGIPPTSPVDHRLGSKREKKAKNNEAIMVNASGTGSQPLASSQVDNLDDVD